MNIVWLLLIYILTIIIVIYNYDIYLGFKEQSFTYPLLYFINLEESKDRLKKMTKMLKKIDYPEDRIVRINAIKKDDGSLGCGLSHIEALKKGLETDEEFFIILEDDFKFIPKKKRDILGLIKKGLEAPNWNMILLACNGDGQKHSKYLKNNIDCQTTSGYIIKKSYVPILLKRWEDSMKLKMNSNTINKDSGIYKHTCIDYSWKQFQDETWFITNPILGCQRAGFSTIENGFRAYGV